jgi:hypothetical protein
LAIDIHLTLKDTIALSNKIQIEKIRFNTSEGRVDVVPNADCIKSWSGFASKNAGQSKIFSDSRIRNNHKRDPYRLI